MHQDMLQERFFEALVNGHRSEARRLADLACEIIGGPQAALVDLLWPAYEQLDRLYRADQISRMSYQFGTRLLRTLVEQLARQIPRELANGTTVVAFCGTSEAEEIGAQIAVEVLDAAGFTVRFAGGGIACDEILSHVHENRPDVLLMFASAASDLPGIRTVIDTLREINGAPNTRIVVGAGVFNRAPGLAEELGAELSVLDPLSLVDALAKPRLTAERIEERKPLRRRARAA